MRLVVCKGCGKFLGYDLEYFYCNEECQEKHKQYKWSMKNNFGVPSGDSKYITKTLLCNYRTWAKERGIEFNIVLSDIIDKFKEQNGRCALTGEELYFVPVKNASLDRIDSNVEYEIGNIQWILKDVNKMKNNLPEDRFIELCKKVVEYNDGDIND